MLEHLITNYLPIIIHILEIMGIIIITIGSIKAFYFYILSFFKKNNYQIKYEFANAMAMGLEFKLAAEILKTVLIREIGEILILASIILLRALLAFIIHMEIKADNSSHNTFESHK